MSFFKIIAFTPSFLFSSSHKIKEKDEPWEFLKLKTQIYEIVR